MARPIQTVTQTERMEVMRSLTSQEIDRLATSEKVRYPAVINFLSSLSGNKSNDIMNLGCDAKQYGWNSPTVGAILKGIELAYKEEEQEDAEE